MKKEITITGKLKGGVLEIDESAIPDNVAIEIKDYDYDEGEFVTLLFFKE